MAAFIKSACSLQRLFFCRRPQLKIPPCGPQLQSLKTLSPSASPEAPKFLYHRRDGETIMEHLDARQDVSKMPLGYSFVDSRNLPIARRCRFLGKQQQLEIFACCTKKNFPLLFGLYVPSDVVDFVTLRFEENLRKSQKRLRQTLKRAFPYMPRKHKIRFYAKPHEGFIKMFRCEGKNGDLLEEKMKLFIRESIKKKEGDLSEEEVTSLIGSWRDGSKIPKIECI